MVIICYHRLVWYLNLLNGKDVEGRLYSVCVKFDALCDLVPFVQFRKREKHPWRSVNFNKVGYLGIPPWVFFTFFKLYKWYQIAQRTTCMILFTEAINQNCSVKILFWNISSNLRKIIICQSLFIKSSLQLHEK